MYILYYKSKKNNKGKLKMRGWYNDLYIMKKYGCNKPYKYNYYYCIDKDFKNIMEV